MSQAVGHLREATKACTGPKMKVGLVSSAMKFPERNLSDGVKATRPLACRRAMAFALAARALTPLPTTSTNPKNITNRRIKPLLSELEKQGGKKLSARQVLVLVGDHVGV